MKAVGVTPLLTPVQNQMFMAGPRPPDAATPASYGSARAENSGSRASPEEPSSTKAFSAALERP